MSQMMIERVTNRVWGIFSSLDQDTHADNDNRRELLKVHIASLVARGEQNGDKLTVDGLVYLKALNAPAKKPARQGA